MISLTLLNVTLVLFLPQKSCGSLGIGAAVHVHPLVVSINPYSFIFQVCSVQGPVIILTLNMNSHLRNLRCHLSHKTSDSNLHSFFMKTYCCLCVCTCMYVLVGCLVFINMLIKSESSTNVTVYLQTFDSCLFVYAMTEFF